MPETIDSSTIGWAFSRFSIGAGATYLPLAVLNSSFLRPVSTSWPRSS